jgi:hypothetical protein
MPKQTSCPTLTFSNLPPETWTLRHVDVHSVGSNRHHHVHSRGGYTFGDGSSAAVELNTDSFTEAFVSEVQSNNFKAFAFDQQVDGFGQFDLQSIKIT